MAVAIRQACAATGCASVMIEGGSRILSAVLASAVSASAVGESGEGEAASAGEAVARSARCIADACVITVAPVLVGGTRAIASPLAPADACGTFDASAPRPRIQFPTLVVPATVPPRPGVAAVGTDSVVFGELLVADSSVHTVTATQAGAE